jgi:hypothetical protein
VKQRHLVTLWNPTYAADAMDAHLAVLLGNVAAYREGRYAEDDVYVWWGKVRSSNRQQPMAHLEEILALDDELGDLDDATATGAELHLYLTDYRSLYVGHVGGITADDKREERTHVPDYYEREDLHCDCWFQLWDIRRVVFDDTPAVVEELRRLRNIHYHDRPVSIYGGMVDPPLLVTRDDGMRYFDPAIRDSLIEGRYWCEFDLEHSGVGQMEHDLRCNLFGEKSWGGLDPAARRFIASAEKVFREHRDDPAFDFSSVLVDLSKAMEVQGNAVLRRALARAPQSLRYANVDGRSVDVAAGDPLSLGTLGRVIGDTPALGDYLRQVLGNGAWFAGAFPAVARELAGRRNPAAHTGRTGRDEASTVRDQLVGIGCTGTLVELGKVRVP